MPLTVASTNEQKVPIVLAPATAAGHPATIQPGSLVLTVESGDATVEAVDDNNFFVVSGAGEGQSTIRVQADGDPGTGIVSIDDVITYDVTLATAVSLGLSAGAPVPK